MHAGQQGARAPNTAAGAAAAAPSTSLSASDPSSSSRGLHGPPNMAGIGAGRSGAASSSYRSFGSTDSRPHYDTRMQWSTSDSSHQLDQSPAHAALSTTPSASSFDTQSQSRSFDIVSMPSSSSLHTLPSTLSLAAATSSRVPSSATSSSSSSSHRAITEAELLAFVNEKRQTAAIKSASAASSDAARSHSKDASDTTNALDTLDLCHKRIDRVPDALVDLIQHDVVRLALGYNHITRLPASFADLHSLRYLNIRANNFAHFPDCVTHMPNLEILDLSRNKIRELPQQPGRLLSLRVLSMNANRLTELPLWVGKMKHLRILKLDNNPLEWPPPHISKMPNVAPPKAPGSSRSSSAAERDKAKRFEDRQMLVWIAKLRSWINDPENQPDQNTLAASASTADASAAMATNAEMPFDATPQPGTDDTRATQLPESSSASSTDLISLQVHVPESVAAASEQIVDTANAHPALSHQDVASNAAVTSNPSTTSGPSQVSAGLLPPLVPQPSTNTETAEAAAEAGSTEHESEQARMRRDALNEQPLADPVTPHTARATPTASTPITATHRIAAMDAENRSHGRNNSHSVVHDMTLSHQMEGRRSLKTKKSLPDLRKSHEDILMERRNASADQLVEQSSSESKARGQDQQIKDRFQQTDQNAASLATPAAESASASGSSAAMLPPSRKPLLQTRRMPRPSLGGAAGTSTRPGVEGAASGNAGGGLRKLSLPTVGATKAAADAAAAALAARAAYAQTPPRFDVGHGRMSSDRGEWPSRAASPTLNGARAAADHERNSYFRRLSTLPPATISKAVPAPVLKFVDGTRGVLFALSQIHAAIGQFMTPVIDERISGQFHRLLDISNGSVANLINALDRFDSLSRRGTPDPAVIRGVLVTCKDSVITFRKLVSVLQLQLRALQSSSDVRYARTLLLMLYGSMAEVSNSWTEMAPLLEAVQPYLTQADQEAAGEVEGSATPPKKPTPPSTRAGSLSQKSTSIPTGVAGMLPSIAEASTPVRSGTRPHMTRGPSRRRHAGSFSAQDLAQGAAMTPSTSNQPPFNLGDLQAASAYSTPARGARARRQGSWGNSASSTATFAQSDSDRSAVEQPSTPVGAVLQRGVHSTPAMSTPTSRQKRSGSNASSAMDAQHVGGTPKSHMGTPATPATPAEARKHAAAPSTGTGGVGKSMQMPVADTKITVDDHLLDMVDNITKLSARTWSILFEHLRTAGVDKRSGDDEDAPAIRVDAAEGEEASVERLRGLRDLAGETDELTSQLRSTYLRAREQEHREDDDETRTEAISQATAAALFEESHQFVRKIVETSTMVKAISVGHEFPRELRRGLGQVAQACSNLTVYLLWLSPAPGA
ncbi:related to SOG2 - key component of the RAM signaling network [Moesziomyces antarcticus]|nr:related to SOG2 - key component of the RAM signaling network [Moesziomyces antarcticus]